MPKIVVAEDDKDIRELIALSLTYSGYEVVTAADGQQAIELTVQERPDLIMLDVRMPRLNGYKVLERIKEMPALAETPVVFLSAKGQESEIQSGLDLGAVQYILKPFSPDELIRKIGEIIAQAEQTVVEDPS